MSIGKFVIWAIVFQFIGNIYGALSFLQILMTLFCAVPLTKKLKGLGALKDNMLRKINITTIIIHSILSAIIFTLLVMFANSGMFTGFITGFILVLLLSIKKIGMTDDNVADYYKSHSSHINFDVIEENNAENGVTKNTPNGSYINRNETVKNNREKADNIINKALSNSKNKRYTEEELQSFSKEKQERISELNNYEGMLLIAKQTLEKAKKDLGDNTVETVEMLYKNKKITNDQRDELINAIEGLQVIIEMHPQQINMLEKDIDRLVKEIEISNGQGIYTYANGTKYIGEFKDDKRNGQGAITLTDGSKYVGEFKDDKPNGQGTMTITDGDIYVGEFRNGRLNGQGTMTFVSGSEYVGEWKDNERNGQGIMTGVDGSKYVGEFRNGKKNGHGTHTRKDGEKFIGEFKDDIPGKGKILLVNGDEYVGEWKDGEFIS